MRNPRCNLSCSGGILYSIIKVSIDPIVHGFIDLVVRQCSRPVDPIVVRIKSDEEANAVSGFDSQISTIICNGTMECLLIFLRNPSIQHFLIVIISIAQQCCRYAITILWMKRKGI